MDFLEWLMYGDEKPNESIVEHLGAMFGYDNDTEWYVTNRTIYVLGFAFW